MVGLDIGAWFLDTAALAAIVASIVAFVKTNVWKVEGVLTVFVSLAVGALLGAIGGLAGYVDGGLVPGLTFGVAAGFLASGGWDAIGGLLGKRTEG